MYMCKFIVKNTDKFTLMNIPSIVDCVVIVDCKVLLCSENIAVLSQIYTIIHSLNQYTIAFGH